MPVTRPLTVLPELIFGISFIPPIIFPPNYENLSNNQIMIIKKINKNGELLENNINKNRKNEAIVIKI